jgi:hypothetical protein
MGQCAVTAVLTVGAARDISSVTVSDVTVDVGRASVDSQPEASVLSVGLVEGWETVGDVGQPCTLTDAVGGMFAGIVTDVDCSPPENPDPRATLFNLVTCQMASSRAKAGKPWRVRLSAAGPLADLGRAIVGDEPWPQETDSARVYRILELAGAQHQVNPGLLGPDMVPRDVDSQPAADLCRSVATDALGTLWEQPSDPAQPIRYSPQSLRAWNPIALTWGSVDPAATWATVPPGLRWQDVTTDTLPIPGAPAALTLDCADILADVVFSQRLADLVAYVRVLYGPKPETGDRAEVTAGTPDGIPQVRLDGQLAEPGDAQAVADTIWRARREPMWRLSTITLRQQDLTPQKWAELRAALGVGTRLTINLPPSSPVGPTWQGFLEGWTHTILDDRHSVTLRTSERAMTEPADRWQDVTPTLTWAAVTPTETWDTAMEVG